MEESNKRIFRNTAYLYLRQLIIMALSFISTRIVLDKLGVDDYGIYTLVGGFVAMFTVLNNVLQSATRRFMAIAIGKNDPRLINHTFSTSLAMHMFIAFVVALLLETLGLWLFESYLNIDPARLWAAKWVFHISVFNVVLTIIQTPFIATVTAHEKFDVYAILSIFDVVGKIAVLFLLVFLPGDKLIVYALLMSFVASSGFCIYLVYCRKRFTECVELKPQLDKELFREMIKFSGWDSLGNVMTVLNAQGTTVLLNMFFTTAVNAARGLAGTVTTTIANFVTGFTAAAEPQLAKYYAQDDMAHFEKLIFNISQITLFMLAIIAVPVFFEMEFVLQLWLGQIPEYTAEFIKITVLVCFVQYSYIMLIKGIVAIGKVKQLTLYTSPIALVNLPSVWLVLWLGCSPTAAYWISTLPCFLNLTADLLVLKKYAAFPAGRYVMSILFKNILLVALACIPPFFVQKFLDPGLCRFLVVCTVSVASTVGVMWFFALNSETREMILRKIFKKRYAEF